MSNYGSVLWKLALSAMLLVAFAGCNGKANQPQAADQQQSPAPSGITPPGLEENMQLLVSSYPSNTDAWLIYSRKADEPQIIVFHTEDKGSTWDQVSLPTKKQWEKEVAKENIFVSLPSSQTAMPGWILLQSGATSGKIEKTLYQTTNRGKTWEFLNYIHSRVDGIVTGIVFQNQFQGWISAKFSGNVFVPLYYTADGGRTWEQRLIGRPEGYKYGNVFPPVFEAQNPKNGTVSIEFVGDNKKDTFEYQTTDGGQTWKKK